LKYEEVVKIKLEIQKLNEKNLFLLIHLQIEFGKQIKIVELFLK
jgi:hypothetical protein